MTKKVLVIGAGRMGSIVASELSKNYEVKTADIAANSDYYYNAELPSTLGDILFKKQFDLVVCALPSKYGYFTVSEAIRHKYNVVDLSFCKEDVAKLSSLAIQSGVTVFYDCGLSPGLSNLLVGYLLKGCTTKFQGNIAVGGYSADPKAPYGHVNTWCTTDLLEEYIRPARVLIDGREEIVNPLNEEYWAGQDVAGIGYMQLFISDGLRSLLKNKTILSMDKPTLIEQTIRRIGHLDAVKQLIKNGTFVKEINEKCNQGDDEVLLHVEVNGSSIILHDRAKDGLSAMARTTAFSCAAFCRQILEGKWTKPGVHAPEDIALEDSTMAMDIFLELDLKHGIKTEINLNGATRRINSLIDKHLKSV